MPLSRDLIDLPLGRRSPFEARARRGAGALVGVRVAARRVPALARLVADYFDREDAMTGEHLEHENPDEAATVGSSADLEVADCDGHDTDEEEALLLLLFALGAFDE